MCNRSRIPGCRDDWQLESWVTMSMSGDASQREHKITDGVRRRVYHSTQANFVCRRQSERREEVEL